MKIVTLSLTDKLFHTSLFKSFWVNRSRALFVGDQAHKKNESIHHTEGCSFFFPLKGILTSRGWQLETNPVLELYSFNISWPLHQQQQEKKKSPKKKTKKMFLSLLSSDFVSTTVEKK